MSVRGSNNYCGSGVRKRTRPQTAHICCVCCWQTRLAYSTRMPDSIDIYGVSHFVSLWCILWLNVHPTAKVSKGTNRNMPARNTLVQLLAVYSNPESHNAVNAQRHRQTDRQTDGRTDGQTDNRMMPMPILLCSSIRSPKNSRSLFLRLCGAFCG